LPVELALLTNDEVVHTQLVVDSQDLSVKASTPTKLVAKSISIISSDLASLFTSTVEGAPTAAVSIFAFPSNTLVVDGNSQQQPVYIMAHSSDTGECPVGQCELDNFLPLPCKALHDDPNYEYLSTLSDTP